MPKEKAPRNKTLDTPVAEGAAYLARCIRIENPVGDIGAVLEKTVLGEKLRSMLDRRFSFFRSMLEL